MHDATLLGFGGGGCARLVACPQARMDMARKIAACMGIPAPLSYKRISPEPCMYRQVMDPCGVCVSQAAIEGWLPGSMDATNSTGMQHLGRVTR